MEIVGLFEDLTTLSEEDSGDEETVDHPVTTTYVNEDMRDCPYQVGTNEWWDYAESMEDVLPAKGVIIPSLAELRRMYSHEVTRV